MIRISKYNLNTKLWKLILKKIFKIYTFTWNEKKFDEFKYVEEFLGYKRK